MPFEPVRPVDLPGTLVPRMSRLQGLIAEARGDRELALRRLGEAEAAWRHRLSDDPGDRDAFGAGIADLGRVPVGGLVEPALELGRVLAERARVLAAAGRPEEAAAAAREALELADAVRFDGYRAADRGSRPRRRCPDVPEFSSRPPAPRRPRRSGSCCTIRPASPSGGPAWPGWIDRLAGGVRSAVGDVLGNGSGEEERLLQHESHLLPHARQLHLAQVVAVDEHPPLLGVEEAGQQGNQGALASTSLADEGDGLAWEGFEGDLLENRTVRRIAEGDLLQLHVTTDGRQRRRSRPVPYLLLYV